MCHSSCWFSPTCRLTCSAVQQSWFCSSSRVFHISCSYLKSWCPYVISCMDTAGLFANHSHRLSWSLGGCKREVYSSSSLWIPAPSSFPYLRVHPCFWNACPAGFPLVTDTVAAALHRLLNEFLWIMKGQISVANSLAVSFLVVLLLWSNFNWYKWSFLCVAWSEHRILMNFCL